MHTNHWIVPTLTEMAEYGNTATLLIPLCLPLLLELKEALQNVRWTFILSTVETAWLFNVPGA